MAIFRIVPRPGAPEPWAFHYPGLGGACAWLRDLGCEAGMRVGLCAANLPALPVLFQAAAVLGLDLVVVHHRLPPAERERQLGAAGVDRRFGEGAGATPLPATFADGTIPPAAGGGALVLHTSGTTGQPKRVRLPWERCARAAASVVAHLDLHADESWLVSLPLDHVGGAALVLRACLAGTPLVFAPLDVLGGGAVQAASLVPTQLHRLVRAGADLRGRRLVLGGAPLPPALAAAATAAGARVWSTYGMTETMAMISAGPAGAEVGAVGDLLPGWEARITDADAAGLGRLEVRGPGRCAGYEPQADAGPHTWLATGDLGRLCGHGLVVAGRLDDLIISGGEKVAPAVVEAILSACPGVEDIALVGRPDAEWGQRVEACFVGTAAMVDLAAWARDHLAPHQRPKAWHRIDALPRTALGKIDRGVLASTNPLLRQA